MIAFYCRTFLKQLQVPSPVQTMTLIKSEKWALAVALLAELGTCGYF